MPALWGGGGRGMISPVPGIVTYMKQVLFKSCLFRLKFTFYKEPEKNKSSTQNY